MITICFTGHRNRVCDPRFLDMVRDTWHNDRMDLWLHGGSCGFDTQVDQYAKDHKIQVEAVHPEYGKYSVTSKFAPIARNHEMVDRADMVIACWDGRVNGGTFDTMQYAIKQGKVVITIPAGKIGVLDASHYKQPTAL